MSPHRLCILGLCLLLTGTASAQQRPALTHADVAYDSQHVSQKLDVYLATAERPTAAMIYIHGGGWRAGSKKFVPNWLKQFVAQGQLSVISVEYRFTNVKTHPAQVNDCLRAIQYVRHRAEEWNIDVDRIGVTGGSAGGHLSAWVALHDDVANKDSDDPIARQSSRVTCAVSFAGPTDWSLLEKMPHKHPAYRQLLGYAADTGYEKMKPELLRDVSPISFATHDDPPIMQVHGDKDAIVPLKHAERLHAQLRKLAVTSELVVVPGAGHGVAGANEKVTARPTKFVTKHLLGK